MVQGTVAGQQHTSREIVGLIDRYLRTEMEARALTLAFERGWIDRIADAPVSIRGELPRSHDMPDRNLVLLLAILVGAGVLETGEPLRLSADFRSALEYRDLLEAKLWFAGLVAPDVHLHLDALVSDVPRFMAEARAFELFRYDRCTVATPENVEATRRWVRYTTVLTAYEAPAALERLDLSGSRRLLDVGGNSGEFARQACARTPGLSATVFDLPVVCVLGREHLASKPEAGRVRFVEGDLRGDVLPGGHDLVSFKSVLHDWPDEYAAAFLGKAADALPSGGRIIIFERYPIAPPAGPMPYSMVANLVFLPFFRDPSFYRDRLAALGFRDVAEREIMLEMPFFLITATKT